MGNEYYQSLLTMISAVFRTQIVHTNETTIKNIVVLLYFKEFEYICFYKCNVPNTIFLRLRAQSSLFLSEIVVLRWSLF